jgi:hypothetical protein
LPPNQPQDARENERKIAIVKYIFLLKVVIIDLVKHRCQKDKNLVVKILEPFLENASDYKC